MSPLAGYRLLTLALNLPGPLAVARLQGLGATVIKIEPLTGDPLAHALPRWYESLHQGQTILRLDLKSDEGRRQLDELLARSDLLVTAMRSAALARLGLDWPALHARHPRVCHVAIIGYPPPHEDRPGHDLNYQARVGLVDPPQLPRTCVADLAGAEQAVSAALALLLARERGQEAQHVAVSLADAAEQFAAPWQYGATSPDGVLGGAYPGYGLYPTRDGWIALAALEPHFWDRLIRDLGLPAPDRARLEQAFLARSAAEWEAWAVERGLPLSQVHEVATTKDPIP